MHKSTDYRQRVSAIFRNSRAATNVSQEQMAAALGVNRKTVSKWENGQTCPDIYQTTEWFRVLGLPALPYIYTYLYPNLEGGLYHDHEATRQHLHTLIDTMHADDIEALLYILFGDHGSVPHSVLQMALAHLHCPIDYRVSHAKSILANYNMCLHKGTLVNMDQTLPEIENLSAAIEQGFQAAVENKSGYVSKHDKE